MMMMMSMMEMTKGVSNHRDIIAIESYLQIPELLNKKEQMQRDM